MKTECTTFTSVLVTNIANTVRSDPIRKTYTRTVYCTKHKCHTYANGV